MVKHVEEQWTSKMLLPYIIGGSPELAKEFLLWLRACEDGQLEADNFHFTDKEIELENLKAYGEGHTINVAECMRYLTSKSSPTAILKDPLIADNKEVLFESLNAQDTVDFNDKTTWGDKDYTAIANLIHQAIVPHASNQQRIEGDVQKINIMSRTNVKEGRRTARVIADSVLFHTYNRASVDEKRKGKLTIAEKKKVQRVKGVERITGLFTHLETQLKVAAEEKAKLDEKDEEEYKELLQHFSKGNDKTSAVDIEKHEKAMKSALKKTRHVTKAQRNAEPEITAAVGGKIELRWFAKTREREAPADVLRAEIVFRGIKDNETGIQLQLGELPLSTMDLSTMKTLLKKDELAEMALNNKLREGMTWDKITEITPKSQALKDKKEAFLAWKANA